MSTIADPSSKFTSPKAEPQEDKVSIKTLDLRGFTRRASETEQQSKKGGAVVQDPHIKQLAEKDEEIALLTGDLELAMKRNRELVLIAPATNPEKLKALADYGAVLDSATSAPKPDDNAQNLQAATLALAVVADRLERRVPATEHIPSTELDAMRISGGAVDASNRDSVTINKNLAAEHLAVISRHGIDTPKLSAFLADAVAVNGAAAPRESAPAQEEKKKSTASRIGGWMKDQANQANPVGRVGSAKKPGDDRGEEPARVIRDVRAPDFITGSKE